MTAVMSRLKRAAELKVGYMMAGTFLLPVCFWSCVLLQHVLGQYATGGGYNSYINPMTYYSFTQPYLSGFYGGIGGMPYMSSWQASMYDQNNAQLALNMVGLMGGMGGMGMNQGFGGGYLSAWNSAPKNSVFSFLSLLPVVLSVLYLS